jgi:hypothetical protein
MSAEQISRQFIVTDWIMADSFRFAALSSALVLFSAISSGCSNRQNAASSGSGADTQTVSGASPARADSMASSQLDRLAKQVVDLQREIWSRTSGGVLHETQVQTPPGAPPGVVASPPPHQLPPPAKSEVVVRSDRNSQARRRKTTVAFTEDDVRGAGLDTWLTHLGFRVARTRDGAPLPGGVGTNQIVFGDSVGLEDVRAIALQMYLSGIPARSIRRFNTGNAFRISLNRVPYLAGVPPVSVAQIRALHLASRAEE